MYKYLLWDIDGTILDFLASEEYAIKTLFKQYNIGECTDQMLKVYSEINAKNWQKLEKGEISKSFMLVERFREFFGLYEIDKSIAESFNKDYQITLGDHLVFTDNALEVLEAQKGRYILAAVTNGTKVAQTKKLTSSGLDKIFDYIFISEDVGFEKPSQEYFNHVFDIMGIVDKSKVLIIGDSLTSDMRGGINAGIDTCWYNPKNLPITTDYPITYSIHNLNELNQILR